MNVGQNWSSQHTCVSVCTGGKFVLLHYPKKGARKGNMSVSMNTPANAQVLFSSKKNQEFLEKHLTVRLEHLMSPKKKELLRKEDPEQI